MPHSDSDDDNSSSRKLVLDKSNFIVWRQRTANAARGKALYLYLTGEEPCPKTTVRTNDKGEQLPPSESEQKEIRLWKKEDNKAISLLTNRLPDHLLQKHCLDGMTSSEMWSAIITAHEKTGLHSEMLALNPILQRYQDGEDMDAFIAQKRNAQKKLSALGVPYPDRLLALLLLHSMPESFAAAKSTLTHLHRDTFTFESVADALVSEYILRQASAAAKTGGDTGENAMYATGNRGKQMKVAVKSTDRRRCTKTHCTERNHSKETCWVRIGYPVGHRLHKTPGGAEQQRPTGKQAYVSTDNFDSDDESAHFITEADTTDEVIMLLPSPPSNDISIWYVDSGASHHYCNDRALFRNLEPVTDKTVSVANGASSDIVGHGTIDTDFPVLTNNSHVRFVPSLRYNLLSVSEMSKGGWRVDFTDNACHIRNQDGKTTVATATRSGGIYQLQVKGRSLTTATANVATINITEDAMPTASPLRRRGMEMLWHERTGHLHAAGLSTWSSQQMVVDGPTIGPLTARSLQCEPCAMAKATRAPFPSKATRRATHPLELVHMDVWGPYGTASLDGYQYFLLIVDDYSRYLWVRFMRAKYESFEHFKDYIVWAQRQLDSAGHKLAKVRSDNGGEFLSHQFGEYLRTAGIDHELTVPYSPQQNGVVERANRTIVDSARTMLNAASLPKTYWVAAVRTAVYLRNRLPTSAVKNMTPHEAFLGRKPTADHFRRFGCLAYVHLPTVKRDKMDDRARRCIFIGYSVTSKAWLFYDPATRKTIKSRDATWREDVNGLSDSVGAGGMRTPAPSSAPSQWASTNSTNTADSTTKHTTPELPPASSEAVEAVPSSEQVEPEPVHHEDADEAQSDSPLPPPLRNRIHRSQSLVVGRRSARQHPSSRARDAEDAEYLEYLQDSQPLSTLLSPSHIDIAPSVAHLVSDSLEDDVALLTKTVLDDDPRNYSEAVRRLDSADWHRAMQTEFDSLIRNDTWGEPVELPRGANLIGCGWVYKTKRGKDGSIIKHKARLVARGNRQRYGVDYEETYAPVARYASIRCILAIVAHYDLELHQMDVKSAYLNGDLAETIYMRQPEGFVLKGKESLVLKLLKSLYGLKQAGRTWNIKMDSTLKSHGFTALDADQCIYIRRQNSILILISLYVDDLLIACNRVAELKLFKQQLTSEFDMEDLGEASFVLGIEIVRDRSIRTLTIKQGAYTRALVQRHGMEDCNAVAHPMIEGAKLERFDGQATESEIRLYQAMIGGIMWAAVFTRPDIAFAAARLSQYASNPSKQHKQAVLRVLRYLKGTADQGITYRGIEPSTTQPSLLAYSDSDWAQDRDTRRSVTGYVFLLCGAAISWQSKRQHTVTLSSVEAEYQATVQTAKEAVWWRRFLTALGHDMTEPTVLRSDSQGSIQLIKNGASGHDRTKHVDTWHHFLTELTDRKIIKMHHVGTADMAADILTKGLGRDKHEAGMRMLGMQQYSTPRTV
jgi:transposase InsO family protein